MKTPKPKNKTTQQQKITLTIWKVCLEGKKQANKQKFLKNTQKTTKQKPTNDNENCRASWHVRLRDQD